jgi:glycerol-3-phosphate dehydrogenase
MGVECYDVVVIGGGIHGAGVAQAAAAAGYSVLVLEQMAVANGTSSRSSKLIHGGLRYLEQGQLGLVRECLRERELLLRLAPDLVRLRSFFIPVYAHSVRSPVLIRTGLTLYALLAGGAREVRFKTVPRAQWDGLDGLQTQGLRTVFQYRDAQTDDAALTRAVMASAQSLGACLCVDAEFVGATLAAQADKSEVCYLHEGSERQCVAQVVVNAAGPWVNTVLARVQPWLPPVAVELVQGAHIVLAGRLVRGVYYLESPRNRRPVFAIPWHTPEGGDAVLVGTTETTFVGDPKDVQPLPEEQAYLRETYEYYFSASRAADMLASFAGLRVLPRGDHSHASRPRETRLWPDRKQAPRLLTIYGGKLTAYRATAENVMHLLRDSLPARKPVADTRRLHLSPVTKS